jgi:transposase
LQDRLLPFAQDHKKKWPKTIVVEDGATPHSHAFQENLYSYSEIQAVLWPGNSPELNMIEPVWAHLKKEIKRGGPIHLKEEAIKY